MIDTSTLTIDSHILFRGKMARVRGIDEFRFDGETYIDTDLTCETIDEFDPIPITEELLKELGFEKTDVEGIELWNKTIIPKECTDPLISKFGINLGVFRYCGGWQVETNPSNGLKVDFLHEMEWLVYLATKRRLI